MKGILTFVVLLILGALRYFEYRHRDSYIREHGKLPQGEGIYLRQAKS